MSTLQRYRRYLIAEWEAAELYKRLAQAEPDANRAEVLRQLAALEQTHADRWRSRLESAGESLPPWQPTLRTRLVTKLAPIVGPRLMLPLLEWFERGDADMYREEPEAQDFLAQERSISQSISQLGKGGQGQTDIARSEGRHRGASSGRLRAGIFGVNDGLVSNLSLVMGVAGAEPEGRFILLAGLAGLLAGAFSMATGEYVSMGVQREMMEREISVERAELEENPAEEQEELALIYRAKGLPADDAERVARQLLTDKDVALDTLAREELGLDPGELGSPWGASISSFLSFAAGAFIPVLPYLFGRGALAFVLSAILSAIALTLVGAFSALITGRPVLLGSGRMVLLGAAAATITFLVGKLLGVAVTG